MRLDADEADQIAELMSALATPARVLILARLLDEPATVTQLVDELGLAQASVSNHLRVLRHLDLAVGKRDGRNVIYTLADPHVRSVLEEVLSHVRHS